MERRISRINRELYLFWGRHPNATFSRSAIRTALDCSITELDEALKAMVNAGLVVVDTRNGETFYFLTNKSGA